MAQNITKIKKRINSVTGAYKVTNAMKLISNIKLKTLRYRLFQNQEYTDELAKACEEVFKYADISKSPLINSHRRAIKKLYVIVSSSLGLCGAYNSNIFKLTDNVITKDDELIVLGKKGALHFKGDTFTKINEFSNYNSINDSDLISKLLNYLIDKFTDGEYKEIHLIYTRYKNALTFIPTDLCLLPLKHTSNNEPVVGYPPLMEPTEEILVNHLIPFYLENTLYSKLFESEVCEQASRFNAMDNATKNAEDILDSLQLEYSKERQRSITQEITEIIGASGAL